MSLYHRFKDRFGTAGVVLGVIAIVLAVGGSAIAATGLNGKQKKEVKGIAKSFQGTGPAGAAGTAGTNGTNGKDGAAGKDGTNGSAGAAGKSVKLVNQAPINCGEGGYTYEVEGSGVKNEVCNGEEGPPGTNGTNGNPWTAGGTLPPSSTPGCPCTETGAWGAIAFEAGFEIQAVSFPIPLAAALGENHVHTFKDANFADFDGAGTGTVGCTGSMANPTAPSGDLCVYGFDAFGGLESLFAQDPATGSKGASVAGALLEVEFSGTALPRGTWAVTG